MADSAVSQGQARKAATPAPGYTVRFTKSAKSDYLALREKADRARAEGDAASKHIHYYQLLRTAITSSIPNDPVATKFALPAPLEGVFRARTGCVIVCWTVDRDARTVDIVYIRTSERNEIDTRRVLESMQRAGFDYRRVFDEYRQFTDPGPNASVN